MLNLPVNIIHYVAKSLPLSDLHSLLLSNRKFYEILSSEKFWNYKLSIDHQSIWITKPNKLSSQDFYRRIWESGTLYESKMDPRRIENCIHICDNICKFKIINGRICMIDIWGNYYLRSFDYYHKNIETKLIATNVLDLVYDTCQYYVNFDHQLYDSGKNTVCLEGVDKYRESEYLKAYTRDCKLYVKTGKKYKYITKNVCDFMIQKNKIVCQKNTSLVTIKFYKCFKTADHKKYTIKFSIKVLIESGVRNLVRIMEGGSAQFVDSHNRLRWAPSGMRDPGDINDYREIYNFKTIDKQEGHTAICHVWLLKPL